VIDSITSKVVLIIGRFSDNRKPVLDAIRSKLREMDYSPIMFDFDRPIARNYIETIKTLAGMARFVIADVTDAKVVLQEIDNIVKDFPSTPIKPIIERGASATVVLTDFTDYQTFLDIYVYDNQASLINSLQTDIVAPAEAKVMQIRERRAAAEHALRTLNSKN
jgi:hypothetical protein